PDRSGRVFSTWSRIRLGSACEVPRESAGRASRTSSGDGEAPVRIFGDLVADADVGVESTCIRSEHLRLAGDVRSGVPGRGTGEESLARQVGQMLHPTRLRRLGRLDLSVAVLVEVADGVGDPINVLFDLGDHVDPNRRTTRPGDDEEIRET